MSLHRASRGHPELIGVLATKSAQKGQIKDLLHREVGVGRPRRRMKEQWQERSMLSTSCPGVPSAVCAPETRAVPELRKLSHVSLTSGSLGTLANLSRYKVT